MAPINLTLLQKKRICEEKSRRDEHHEKCSNNTLAVWAKETFKLERPPSKAVMSRILQDPSQFTCRIDKEIAKKRRDKKGLNHAVEKSLFEWVCSKQSSRININGNIIRAKAAHLQALTNDRLPESERKVLTFSEGWLDNFKKRWGLRVFRSHGESGDADNDALEERMPKLREILASYACEDIFNADECGLFYSMAPDKTIATHALPGRKKVKDRLTFMPCCNATGTEKLELVVIGKSVRPRVFRKKQVQSWGLIIMRTAKHG